MSNGGLAQSFSLARIAATLIGVTCSPLTHRLKVTGGIVLSKTSSNLFKQLASFLSALLIACVCVAIVAGAEPPQVISLARTSAKKLISMPDKLSDGWQAAGPAQAFSGVKSKRLAQGEVVLEYGLQSRVSRTYAKGKERLSVELFEMHFPSGAYGFCTFNRAHAAEHQQQLCAGRYVVRLRGANLTEADAAELLRDWWPLSNEKVAPPPLVDHLPKAARVAGSELYLTGAQSLAQAKRFGFLSPAVQFDTGVEAVAALYQPAQQSIGIIIFEFQTPQLASDGYASLESQINAQPDPVRKQTWLKRVGNYAVVATGTAEQAVAEQLTGEIKYTPKVTWAGEKFTSIPLAVRPPDPAALEEVAQTANILLRTFYWIGVMLLFAIFLGAVAGSSFFYWRRSRQLKDGPSVLSFDE
jgi:hypothetical protein